MIASFAIVYTLGNITSLCSSCFLFGPRRQLRAQIGGELRAEPLG